MTDYPFEDDQKRVEALAKWREQTRLTIRSQVPEIKAQLADLTEPGSGISPAVGQALQALVAMQTTLSIQAALNHQIAVSAIIAHLPQEKRPKAMEGLNQMSAVVSEEVATLMDLLF